MPIEMGPFEKPHRIIKDSAGAADNYGKFVAEPFEAGYGVTIGSSLHRALTSALDGSAICAIKIDGASDLESSLPGVVESALDIALNLKGVLLEGSFEQPVILSLQVQGAQEVTAAAIQVPEGVSVRNPDHHIATVEADGSLHVQMDVRAGRGYLTSAHQELSESSKGFIPMDAMFSPVRRVKYSVENTRVGRRTDFDKLILEIWTDGRISPESAMMRAADTLKAQLAIFGGVEEEIVFHADAATQDEEDSDLVRKLSVSMNEIELSVRAANCLNSANISTIADLVQKTESELLKYRNFGRTSLNEIKGKLIEMGLSLGMQIDERTLQAVRRLQEEG